jgi:hypothetical protein
MKLFNLLQIITVGDKTSQTVLSSGITEKMCDDIITKAAKTIYNIKFIKQPIVKL